MRNLPSCNVVADYFLLHVNAMDGDTISNLKIQKLCYYAQAWSLARNDEPLFADQIEAWAHGPVVPELYRRFKKYGSGSIDALELVTDPEDELHEDHKKHLAEIWQKYGRLSGSQLRNLSHAEEPWITARAGCRPAEYCNTEITHNSMRNYYKGLLAKNNDADTRS